jgi:hypothetical protein
LIFPIRSRPGQMCQGGRKWRFSHKNDWVVQVIPQHAIEAIRTGALYSKNSDRGR